MLVVIPLVALALGFGWWLSSGRYVSTDNAYVGADKSLITPQVTGPIVAVHVVEGQKVKVGDPLFDIDPKPYEIALALAKGKLEAAKVEFANLRIRLSQQCRPDQDGRGCGEACARPTSTARTTLAVSRSGTDGRPRHLDGHSHSGQADPRIRQIAAGDGQGEARRRPRHDRSTSSPTTCRRRPLSTTPSATCATPRCWRRSTASRRRCRRSSSAASRPAGQPVFAVVADTGLWVDANPKESDLTYVHAGLPATVSVDTFPGREWKGTVCSIAPGTGAQFSILPPQNASGNWVKVVQRVPLRFCFDPKEDTTGLRAGHERLSSPSTPAARARSQARSRRDQAMGRRLRRHPVRGADRRHR